MMSKDSLIGGSYILAAALLWSLSGFILKTVDSSIAWLWVIRCGVASVILAPFMIKTPPFPLKSAAKTAIFYALLMLAFSLTTRIGSAATAVSMQCVAPLYAMLYAFIRDKRFDSSKSIPLLLLSIGFFILMGDTIAHSPPIAVFTGIIVGLAFMLYSESMRTIKGGSTLSIMGAVNLFTTLFFIVLLPVNASPRPQTPQDIGMLVFAGVFLSAISYSIYGIGVRKVRLSTAMTLSLAEPLLNPLWVFLALREKPSLVLMAGLVFLLAGGFIDIYRASKIEDSLDINPVQTVKS